MSDLAKQYAPGKEPMLVAGTAASYAAGAGTVKPAALGETSVKNSNLAVDGHDDKAK